MKHNYLRVIAAILTILFVLIGTLEAKSKAEKLYALGQAAEAKQDWDKALDYYLQALDLKPGDAQYTMSMRRARFQAGSKHMNAGKKLRDDGKLQEALGEFQKALIADPSSSIAVEEIKRTQTMIQNAKTGEAAGDLALTPVERAQRENEARVNSILGPPELHAVLRSIGPLKINNQPTKVLFETVGKVAGVNVLFDSQYNAPAHNFNVELPAVTPEEAFNYLAVMTHTFWKPLSATAIFVTEDNPTKHRDYDDEVVKTFYVTNATSVQEFQEIATAIRTVADIRRVFTYNAQKAMIVRGSVDAVALAEKLVHDLDKPKAEVVVDVIVMQASSSRMKSLGASLVNASGTGGLSVPFAFSPTNPVTLTGTTGTSTGTGTTTTTTTTTTLTTTGATGTTGSLIGLNQLSHLTSSDFAVSLPGGLLNLMLSDSTTKVLDSPTVRMSDGMKADLKVGEKIPYATGSYQPGVGTVGVSPLVSTQFSYIDTGVELTIQPQVHSASEVTLHVEVNVSSVASYNNIGGIQQPVISQNKNTADLRLHDGEVSILGGVTQNSDTRSVTGIPGVTSIPVLGSVLGGSLSTDKELSDLLIAVIPHIVRTPGYTPENFRAIGAGTDQMVKLNYAPAPEPTPTPALAGSAPAGPAGPSAGATAGLANGPRVTFDPSAQQVAAGGQLTVSIHVNDVKDLFSAQPIRIKYDPAHLRLNDMAAGDLWTQGGGSPSAVKDIRNDAGEGTITITRPPGSAGVNGSGAIVTLTFVAVNKGPTTVTLDSSVVKDSKGGVIPAALGSLLVTVQ
jgi:general secretion pathway protein D